VMLIAVLLPRVGSIGGPVAALEHRSQRIP